MTLHFALGLTDQDLSDSLSGMTVPQRRNASLLGSAFDDLRQLKSKFVGVLPYDNVSSEADCNGTLGILS